MRILLIALAALTLSSIDGGADERAHRLLDALVAAAQEHEAERREVARKDRHPKPWATSKKTAD